MALRKATTIASLLILLGGLCLQAQEVGILDQEAAASITLEEIIDHVYFLASDFLTGRSPGTPGYDIATQYCATQFQAAGALPLVMTEEGEPTYFQTFGMKRVFKSDKTALHFDGTKFEHGTAFAAMSAGKETNAEFREIKVVYVGYGITVKDAGWDDYEGVDADGSFVLMQAGAPMKDGEPVLPPEINKHYENMQQSIMPKLINAKQHGVAGIIIVPPPAEEIPGNIRWEQIIGMMSGDRLMVDSEKGGMNPMGFIDIPFLLVTEDVVNAMLADAPYNPVTGEGEYQSFELEKTIDFVVEQQEEKFKTSNVVAYVPGTDPELRDEYITVGAHLDHIGENAAGINNGADDNASGSVAVLEVAEAVAMNPTRRSVVFLLYSAEESGLIGSRHFVNNPPYDIKQTQVNLNLDMVGRDTEDAPGGITVIGSKARSQELQDIIKKVNAAGIDLVLDFSTDEKDTQGLMSRSDHFNFHQKGVPVAFFSSGLHGEYHTPDDDSQLIVPEKIQKVSKLCYGVIQYLGNRTEKLKID